MTSSGVSFMDGECPELQYFQALSFFVFCFHFQTDIIELALVSCICNIVDVTGLSMNILCMDDKLPRQRGFFTKSVGSLLPTLGFLGGLFSFCNFVIIFSLMQVNLNLMEENVNYTRYTTLKNDFLWFTLGHVTVMRISK